MQLAVNCYIEIQIGYMRGYLIFLLKMIYHNEMFNNFVSIGITIAYMALFYYFLALS